MRLSSTARTFGRSEGSLPVPAPVSAPVSAKARPAPGRKGSLTLTLPPRRVPRPAPGSRSFDAFASFLGAIAAKAVGNSRQRRAGRPGGAVFNPPASA
jgi:hypothetical protein